MRREHIGVTSNGKVTAIINYTISVFVQLNCFLSYDYIVTTLSSPHKATLAGRDEVVHDIPKAIRKELTNDLIAHVA